ncbi:hypothetical protein [Allohahella sp. A8]|uniref:TolB family protein n=1 Tax=Allohahella sp. A8 TaxID=3141461 RepID=UPI003A8098E9
MKIYTRKSLIAISLACLGLVACGGSSSDNPEAVTPSPESPAGSNFTKGLTGTLYFKRQNRYYDALDIATGQIRQLRDGTLRFGGYSTSYDGTLHTMTVGFHPPNDFLNRSSRLSVLDDGGREVYVFNFVGEAETEAVISPDNQYIAVVVKEHKAPFERGLRIYSVSGQLVRFIPDTEKFVFMDINYNRNGALLVSAYRNGLYFMTDPLVDEPQLLRETPEASMVDMTVSPDGESLAYVSAGDRQLYILDPESSEPRQLTYGVDNTKLVGGFDWSPDGKYLAFVYYSSPDSCLDSNMLIIEASADMERLPSNTNEVKAGSSSEKIFPVDAYIPLIDGPFLSLLGCISGDPSWR